ncbi:MAG: hypothetical protein QM758_17800 [Armatimonas sp.]
MSFDSGPDAYTPPPPKRGLSPWAWVGIGCGTITLLGFGGCAFLAYRVVQEVNNIAPPEQSLKTIQDAKIPIYPGATMDPMATKYAGGTINIMGKMLGKNVKTAMVAFSCSDPASKVHLWYKERITAMGYSEQAGGDRGNPAGRNVEQHMFVKGDEMVLIQTQDPTTNKSGSMLITAYFKGIKNRNVTVR